MLAHYPRGWGMASNTPFRLYKRSTHAGGVRVPMIVSWPGGIPAGRPRCGAAPVPVRHRPLRHGARPRGRAAPVGTDSDGASFAAAITGGSTDEHPPRAVLRVLRQPQLLPRRLEARRQPSARRALRRHRMGALRHRGRPDRDRSTWPPTDPDKVRELAEAWDAAAWDNQVFPLDDGTGLLQLLRRPDDARFHEPVRHPARHADARALPVAAADRLPQLRRRGRGRPRHGRRTACSSPTAIRAAATRSTSTRRRADLRLQPLRRRRRSCPQGRWRRGRTPITLEADATRPVPVGLQGATRRRRDGLAARRSDPARVRARSRASTWASTGDHPSCWDVYERHGAFPYSGTLHAVTYRPGPAADYDPEQLVDALRGRRPSRAVGSDHDRSMFPDDRHGRDRRSPMPIEVVPLSQHTGAEIRGVTLSPDLDDATVGRSAPRSSKWKVIFFRDQDLDRDTHVALGARFGEVTPAHPTLPPRFPDHPEIVVIQKDAHGHDDPDETILEHRWHSDVTYTASAADGLDPASRRAPALRRRHRVVQPRRRLRRPVRAAQDDDRRPHRDPPQRAPPRCGASPTSCRRTSSPSGCGPRHPVVSVHPETGEKVIYVNPDFTSHIYELTRPESDHVLALPLRPARQSRVHRAVPLGAGQRRLLGQPGHRPSRAGRRALGLPPRDGAHHPSRPWPRRAQGLRERTHRRSARNSRALIVADERGAAVRPDRHRCRLLCGA